MTSPPACFHEKFEKHSAQYKPKLSRRDYGRASHNEYFEATFREWTIAESVCVHLADIETKCS